MRVAYLDCFRGISGAAVLAGLIDAGADAGRLDAHLASIADGLAAHDEEALVGEFRVRRVRSSADPSHFARTLADAEASVRRGDLPSRARELASRVYRRVAEAEARVHGTTPEAVTFHEVGSSRSFIGVVGTAIALDLLSIDVVVASPLPWGRGTADTEHGRVPLPAPATLELLRGLPLEPQEVAGELVTPTGAAIVSEAASSFGPMPAMTVEAVGYGAGDVGSPVMLRVIVGRSEATPASPRGNRAAGERAP